MSREKLEPKRDAKYNRLTRVAEANVRIVVTGGIAAGKSTVIGCLAHRLKELDDSVHYFSVDELVHEVYARLNDPECHDSEVEWLRDQLHVSYGTLDRRVIARMAFENGEIKELERLFSFSVNKLIGENLARKATYNLCEFPLLAELGNKDMFDFVINVEAPLAVRRERALQREGMNDGKLDWITERQAADDERRRIADYSFVNDGDLNGHLDELVLRLRAVTTGPVARQPAHADSAVTQGDRVGVV